MSLCARIVRLYVCVVPSGSFHEVFGNMEAPKTIFVFGNQLVLFCDKNNRHAEVIETIVHLSSRNQNKILIYLGTFYVVFVEYFYDDIIIYPGHSPHYSIYFDTTFS